MRRRDFIVRLGLAAIAWPRDGHAQQHAMPVIGFLSSGAPGGYVEFLAAFRRGLAELGYVDGETIAIEQRWAEGRFELLPFLAGELVQHRVAVLVTTGVSSALAAKAAAPAIPLVFMAGDDPVKFGLVASLNRPGGNATGVSWLTAVLMTKRLEFVRELVPGAALIAFLVNPKSPEAEPQLKDIESASRTIGQPIEILNASGEVELDAAFASLVRRGAVALIVSNDAFFNSQRDRIVGLATRHRVPAIYDRRAYAAAGGLVAYGAPYDEAYRQLGVYTGRVLKGAKPADLPVEQPTRFELIVNLRTAKALGLTIPPAILARADEVIE
jgi:putative ABC transport system substrate-binding protein